MTGIKERSTTACAPTFRVHRTVRTLIVAAFTALMFGTVASGQSIVLEVGPDTTVDAGDLFWLTVAVDELVASDSVASFQMTLNYPAHRMEFTETVENGPVVGNTATLGVDSSDGRLRVAWYGSGYLTGKGVLFRAQARVFESVGDGAKLDVILSPIESSGPFYFNEGWSSPPRPNEGWDGIPLRDVETENAIVTVSNPGVINSIATQPKRAMPTVSASPNPFNPQVRLLLQAPDGGMWNGMIVNTAGQVVRRWSMNAEGGSGTWTWDSRDDRGVPVSSGVYIAAIEHGTERVRVRVTLVR